MTINGVIEFVNSDILDLRMHWNLIYIRYYDGP